MLSVVVNFFNMRREARNTLYSLSRRYQHHLEGIEYEVIAIDNGSGEPLCEEEVRGFGPEFHYRFHDTPSPSPVEALNAACAAARGEHVMVLIDGAHILSPGILHLTHEALRTFSCPFVATVAMHLGPQRQNDSITKGYTREGEDRLLEMSGWRANGYKLFSAAGTFADDSLGWFGCPYESNCFTMHRKAFLEMGGFDCRFQSRGGGLANLEFFYRNMLHLERDYIMLLGEATFHQLHFGVASNTAGGEHPWLQFNEEFLRIRGQPYQRVLRRPTFLGAIPPEAQAAAKISAMAEFEWWQEIDRSLASLSQQRQAALS